MSQVKFSARGDRFAACLLLLILLGGITFSKPSAAQSHQHDHGHARHDHPEERSHSHEEPAAGQSRAGLWGLLGLYSVLIASASLFGGWLPGHVRLTHLRFQLILSLIGGLILGIGVLHLMVHAQQELGSADLLAQWMMAGMLLMFVLLRMCHVHHHEPEIASHGQSPEHNRPADEACTTHHAHGHSHAPQAHGHHHPLPHSGLSWLGIFFGLAVHTLLDGLALGATMQAEAHHGTGAIVGLGILLAIALHKPLDSLSITTLMMGAGQPARLRWLVNLIYASLCPIGAACFLLGVGTLGEAAHTVVGCSLAFSAGVFICIALADILPEMEFHSHHRMQLSIALLLGIALAWLIQFLEPAHYH